MRWYRYKDDNYTINDETYKKYVSWKSKLLLLGASYEADESDLNHIVILKLSLNSKQLRLPEGIRRIEDCALDKCENVKELILPESMYYVGEELPDTLGKCNIPKGMERLNTYSFSSTITPTLKLVINGEVEIQPRCFQGRKQLWLSGPGHITEVTRFGLEKMNINSPVDLSGSTIRSLAFKRSTITRLIISDTTVVEPYAFQHGKITKLVVQCKDRYQLDEFKRQGSEFRSKLDFELSQSDCKILNPIAFIVKGDKIK